MPMKIKMQRVEHDVDGPMHCPYCGALVLSAFDLEAELVQEPCPHTVFIAHDEAFEHLDDRAKAQYKEKGYSITDYGIELAEDEDESLSIDEATDLLEFPDAVKFARYEGPPSQYGSYLGFARFED